MQILKFVIISFSAAQDAIWFVVSASCLSQPNMNKTSSLHDSKRTK